MFLATLLMVAGVTLTSLSSSLGSGPAPSFSISCFSIRTQCSWHFTKGTEETETAAAVLGAVDVGKMTEEYKLSLLKVLIA